MSVTTYTVKNKIKDVLQRFESTAFSDGATSLSSDTLENVDISINSSVVTAATSRIGQETVRRVETEVKVIVEDGTLGVKRIGRVTVLGDGLSTHDIDDFKQGHNVKTLNQTVCSLLPHMTINSPEVIDSLGNVVNLYEETTFGQLYSYYFNVISDGIERKNHPFYDYPGRLDPVNYVKKGSYFRSYMIITDNVEDYNHYIEPDSIIHDGGIDVFEVRSQKANTHTADLQTKGIRASICSGPWDLPAGSTTELRKGTSMIVDEIEVREYKYDWFEDCQDLVFADKKFSRQKSNVESSTTLGSGYKYSLDGYVSEGHYGLPPFEDITARKLAYQTAGKEISNQHISSAITNNESLRDVSVIGKRFKSSANGSILRPKYETVIQSILGTDSIAFAGYLRE